MILFIKRCLYKGIGTFFLKSGGACPLSSPTPVATCLASWKCSVKNQNGLNSVHVNVCRYIKHVLLHVYLWDTVLTDRAQPPNTDCRHLEKMPQPLKRMFEFNDYITVWIFKKIFLMNSSYAWVKEIIWIFKTRYQRNRKRAIESYYLKQLNKTFSESRFHIRLILYSF